MSMSDIWGATDKEIDPDEIIVPQDPAEAYRAGMLMGVNMNLTELQEWINGDGKGGFTCMDLKCTPEELRLIEIGHLDYWFENSDRLAQIRWAMKSIVKHPMGTV
ncbi:hypothetical protein hairong_156 [Pseudomonas phage hairong]|nr:hypothetical protein hairong_156 [Pseudomonas phage hairong]